MGVNPAQEGISFLGGAKIVGEFLRDGADGRILVGRALAEQLETKVGRRLVIITQGADGLSREAGFRIAGLYEGPGRESGEGVRIHRRRCAAEVVGRTGVHRMSIRLHEEPALAPMKERLAARLTDLDVLDWRELAPQAAGHVPLCGCRHLHLVSHHDGRLGVRLGQHLGHPRSWSGVRELGMLRALGMRPGSVVLQVVLEAGILMLMGVAVGVALAGAVIYWLAGWH